MRAGALILIFRSCCIRPCKLIILYTRRGWLLIYTKYIIQRLKKPLNYFFFRHENSYLFWWSIFFPIFIHRYVMFGWFSRRVEYNINKFHICGAYTFYLIECDGCVVKFGCFCNFSCTPTHNKNMSLLINLNQHAQCFDEINDLHDVCVCVWIESSLAFTKLTNTAMNLILFTYTHITRNMWARFFCTQAQTH